MLRVIASAVWALCLCTPPASVLAQDTQQEVLEKLDALLVKLKTIETRIEELDQRLDRVTAALIKKIDHSLAVAVRDGGQLAKANPLSAVSGVITLDGRPVDGATIIFVPADGGRPSGARTDENGRYQLRWAQNQRGAIAGRHHVRISTQADPYEGIDGVVVPATPERIPAKYNTQTVLTVDVAAEMRNIFDFDLTSE